MERKSAKGERVKQNILTLVEVLLELAFLQDEETEYTEYKDYLQVQAKWDDSGYKLKVTGSQPGERRTSRGNTKNKETEGVTKVALIQLIEDFGKRLYIADTDRSEAKRKLEEVQYILDYLRELNEKSGKQIITQYPSNTNKGYWIFDLTLKHSTCEPIEHINYLKSILEQFEEPRGIERIIQNTDYPQERLNIFSQDSTRSLLNLDEQRRVRIQANQYKQALFKHLVTLNFSAQKKRIEMFRKYNVGAFLIHGESAACGQEVLVRYFFLQELNVTDKQPIYIDIRQSGMGYRTDSILKRLSNYLANRYSFITDIEIEEIVDNICEIWQSQDVLIIFDHVHEMLPDIRKELMNKFWRKIVKKVHEAKKYIQSDNRIILLLVDYSQSSHQETELSMSEIQENVFYDPVILPQNQSFSQTEDKKVLEKWLNQSIYKKGIIPEGLTTNRLLQDSANGVPRAIYSIICEHCCYDGEEFLDWVREW